MRVVGAADDAFERLHPDLLMRDLAMPGMDGLTVLAKVMGEQPILVAVVSSSSTR